MYVDWGTKIIHVLETDMTIVQSVPSVIYDLSLDWFRLELKDLEDDQAGMPYPDTHKHDTETLLDGTTYARKIEILAPYTVTFEDGQYAVNLIGANSNVASRTNVNQVSIRPQNSAGLVSNVAGVAAAIWDTELSRHTGAGSFGGELATKADISSSASTDQSSAVSGSVISGTELTGTYQSCESRDNVLWQILEDAANGITVEMVFNLPTADHRPGSVNLYGRYNGQPAGTHYLDLFAFNHAASSWEQLMEEFIPGGSVLDSTYKHEFYERHVNRGNNNEVKIRISHNETAYNASHLLSLDYVDVSSIKVITANDVADAVWNTNDALKLLEEILGKAVISADDLTVTIRKRSDDTISHQFSISADKRLRTPL